MSLDTSRLIMKRKKTRETTNNLLSNLICPSTAATAGMYAFVMDKSSVMYHMPCCLSSSFLGSLGQTAPNFMRR